MAKDTFANKKLAVIGGGHMGLALIEGFIHRGKVSGSRLIVANPSLLKINHLEAFGIKVTTDNKIAAENADWVFLAVKPLIVEHVLAEIKDEVKGKLIISLAAAVGINTLHKYMDCENQRIARIMPNIPVSVHRGVIGLFINAKTSIQDKEQLNKLLSPLGLVVEVEKEEHLNAFTLLSACGPAIVSQYIELFVSYGKVLGLSDDMAEKVARETFHGTVTYLQKLQITANQLIQSVATKGGITEAILYNLKQKGIQEDFMQAMETGHNKIKELDRKLNKALTCR